MHIHRVFWHKYCIFVFSPRCFVELFRMVSMCFRCLVPLLFGRNMFFSWAIRFLPVIDFIHKLFAAQFPGLPIWDTTLVILVKFEMGNPKKLLFMSIEFRVNMFSKAVVFGVYFPVLIRVCGVAPAWSKKETSRFPLKFRGVKFESRHVLLQDKFALRWNSDQQLSCLILKSSSSWLLQVCFFNFWCI